MHVTVKWIKYFTWHIRRPECGYVCVCICVRIYELVRARACECLMRALQPVRITREITEKGEGVREKYFTG